MKIVVQQQIHAFSADYEIETPGCIYSAKRRFFYQFHRIKLFDPRSSLRAKIRGHFFFRPKYTISMTVGKTYRFWCEKLWKGVFACENANETLRLYQHRGLNYSIFQNNVQIARFSKNRVKYGRTDRYEIWMSDNANLCLIICMALVIDCGEIYDDGTTAGMMTIDMGSLGPEERPFDSRWQPS